MRVRIPPNLIRQLRPGVQVRQRIRVWGWGYKEDTEHVQYSTGVHIIPDGIRLSKWEITKVDYYVICGG